jgi:3-hydroxybutyryl-CoA dehydrogenase
LAVEKIAVIGAGVIGRGTAHTGALGGFEVRMHDVHEEGPLASATRTMR